MVDTSAILHRYDALSPHLDERGRRSFAASEARVAGHGGIAAVSRATGIAASTIGRGLKELACGSDVPANRVRRLGGGRKKLVATDTRLLDDLLALVSPGERGDPMSPLRWTCKSLRRLAAELCGSGTGSATPSWANCSSSRGSAFRPTARRVRAVATRTGTRNSPTSMLM
jgi:hypothetical protein